MLGQLPLPLGGTRQDVRNAGTLRPGGSGTQQQGRASRLRETGFDENSVVGRLRTAGGRKRCPIGVSVAAIVIGGIRRLTATHTTRPAGLETVQPDSPRLGLRRRPQTPQPEA
jgi:hypothetical protein